MRTSTADQVLSALHHYDLTAKPGGRYLSNSPLRPGSNSHALSLIINGPEHGAYVDFVSGEKGSLYDLAAKLGIEIPEQHTATRTLVATYDYVSESGQLLYQACRYEPGKNGKAKEFTQRVPDGNGGWVWTMDGVTRVLYRLPEVMAAVARGAWVYIVEGEKDADLLTMYGLAATTNVAGAGKWRPEYSAPLRGANVAILPDNDKPGATHATTVAGSLHGIAATVRVIELPGLGPKGDVSDWIATGHTIDELQTLVMTAPQAAPVVPIALPKKRDERIELMKHPTTGVPLYLPPGYSTYSGVIMKSDESNARHLYSGMLAVTGTGTNLHSGEETVTVVYDRYNALVETTVPRMGLTSGQKCAEALGQGIYVHSGNSRELSRYLVEFIRANESTLPRVNLVDRLGTVGDDGLVLPAGTIGIEGETRYMGTSITVGTDRSAYPLVLKEAATWDNLTAFWAVFALGLAGPALARMKPDRNPVVMLANASGSGKSTLLNFTIGAYGDPLVKPVRIQCGSGTTTAKGISQYLAQTNGVPVHLEDIHMLMEREPLKFAGLIYDYANGQLRSYGTLDQRGGGGTHLGGTMLMSGEMSPELQYEGSQRRLMVINCRQWAPLGAEARSTEGGLRADVLNSAWKSGAGLFGHDLCTRLWANWGALERESALFQADRVLADLQAWKPLLATAAAVLKTALTPLGIQLDYALMLKQWAGLYAAGQQERDPSREAFDKALTMLSQCEVVNDSEMSDHGHRSSPTWEWLMYERKMVAAHRVGDRFWRVLTTSPQWREVVGPGAVDMFGDVWLHAGMITPHSGKRPISERIYTGPGKGNLQCILIPTSHLEDAAR
jgi:hypothetical protein